MRGEREAGQFQRVGRACFIGLQHAVGKQAGKQIVRILKGEKPGDMASETSENLVLILNLEAARKQGVELSAQLQSEASEILGR